MKQMLNGTQLNICDLMDTDKLNIVKEKKAHNYTDFSRLDFFKYDYYNMEKYKQDIYSQGLRQTWNNIIDYALNNEITNNFISVDNFAELYEIGLAIDNKQQKKNSGQYYTPNDVAYIMADWLHHQKGDKICDVGCGTGKLILAYLKIIGKADAENLIRNGNLYLYDTDDVALNICKTIILIKYGKKLEQYLHIIHGDFLSKQITLPKNCKVISNPPYATVENLSIEWAKTNIASETKELYAMFMEKIIKQSESSVMITPYSFIGGNKFYNLRYLMNDYNGFIVSFDNVPGNIFCGKKQGIFNTNTANSVRAAITVVENKNGYSGFKLTPLIRFKNEERNNLLKTDVLETFINDNYQTVSKKNLRYCKCAKELSDIWTSWTNKSNKCLKNYICQSACNILSVPNTCRYYTTAFKGVMNRSGQIVLRIDDENVFNYTFCLLNSSFAYWYWRLYDGGITYPKNLLLNMPVFYDLLSDDDKLFFKKTADEMIKIAPNYVTTKKNMGVQENIKYPRIFRDKINKRMLKILGVNVDEKIFDIIHSNMALEVHV